MRRRFQVVALPIGLVLTLPAAGIAAEPPSPPPSSSSTEVGAGYGDFIVGGGQVWSGRHDSGSGPSTGTGTGTATLPEVPSEAPNLMCMREAISGDVDPSILCPEAAEPEPQEAAAPVVTPGMVLEAFEAVGLPEAVLQVQPPDGRTLVNLDTNFFATAEPFSETVTLLGQAVELDISATGFAWDFGDGATRATSTPGASYPDLEVTHAYASAGTVSTGVAITWSARFRVDGERGPRCPARSP